MPTQAKGKDAAYFAELARVKRGIIGMNYHIVEYHISKVSRGDYLELKNKIPLRDLWKPVLIRLLEDA